MFIGRHEPELLGSATSIKGAADPTRHSTRNASVHPVPAKNINDFKLKISGKRKSSFSNDLILIDTESVLYFDIKNKIKLTDVATKNINLKKTFNPFETIHPLPPEN